MSNLKSKHAFGSEQNIDQALANGLIDAYDILFLNEGKIGWIDKNGNKVIVEDKKQVLTVDELPEAGNSDTVYICGSKFYFWNGSEFTTPDGQGVDESTVNAKVNAAVEEANAYTNEKVETVEKIKYEISHKPVGTLVGYYDKEIRVMCAADTEWTLQQSGDGADPNSYYIGFKAYAPSDDIVSFKEDLGEIITDTTMYYFEDNDFAGIDEYGRKYSIVWLPVAVNKDGTWTYHGVKSSDEKYIGWYYSVEWYNADKVLVASDCIRINLSNESCHSSVEPFYINSMIGSANAYTDEQIAAAIAIVEF